MRLCMLVKVPNGNCLEVVGRVMQPTGGSGEDVTVSVCGAQEAQIELVATESGLKNGGMENGDVCGDSPRDGVSLVMTGLQVGT
jgi:hypothetical protein